MAQHCFIQSAKLDPRIAAPWFNLGIFYLERGDMQLSNRALAKAQACDPEDVNAWVGMALQSELMSSQQVLSSLTMDLFRHSAQLTFHKENALCYAKWVLRYLLNPDARFKASEEYRMQMDVLHAVSKAHECMVMYVRRKPGNPVGHLALGQLCERLG